MRRPRHSLAACGGGSAPAAAAQTTYQKTLAYAQCVRVHGVPGFPDPGPNGQVPKTAVVRAFSSTSNSVAQSASKACQHLMPQGGLGPQRPQLSASQQQQLQAQVLRAAKCIRSHGVPNLPDPTVDSHGDISVGGNVNGNGIGKSVIGITQGTAPSTFNLVCDLLLEGGTGFYWQSNNAGNATYLTGWSLNP